MATTTNNDSRIVQQQQQTRRKQRQQRRRNLRPGTVCTLFLKDTQYERNENDDESNESNVGEGHDEIWACEVLVPVEVEVEVEVAAEDFETATEEKEEEVGRKLGKKERQEEKKKKKKRKKKKREETQKVMKLEIVDVPMMIDIDGLDNTYFVDHGAISGTTTMVFVSDEVFLLAEEHHDDSDSDDSDSNTNSDSDGSTSTTSTTTFSVPMGDVVGAAAATPTVVWEDVVDADEDDDEEEDEFNDNSNRKSNHFDNGSKSKSITSSSTASSDYSINHTTTTMIITKLVIPETATVELIDVDVDIVSSSSSSSSLVNLEDENSGEDLLVVYEGRKKQRQRQRQLLRTGNHTQDQQQQQSTKQQDHRRGRQLAPSSSTNMKTIVVRIKGNDGSQPIDTTNSMREMIFGTDDASSSVSVATQLKACSFDQLQLIPYHGGNGQTSVVDIQVNATPSTSTTNTIAQLARTQVRQLYDYDSVGLVIYCLPEGTLNGATTKWVAYAYVSGKESFYNDKWCGSLSALSHEIGHSIGFLHSGEIENGSLNAYSDKSGYMGYSYFERFTPRMCFNAAKNYQTNWYNGQKAHYDPMNGKITRVTATMNGIVDFTKYTNTYVVIQLKDGDGSKKNYYVGYNRQKSFNEGTRESANSITIVEKMGTYSSTAASTKVATLTLSQNKNSYTIPNWGGASSGVSVVVTLDRITNNSDDATITIVTKNTGTGSTPNTPPTRSPTTRSPTPQPTAEKVTTPNTTCTGDSTTYRWRGNANWNCEWVGKERKKKKRRCSKSQDEQSVTDYWCCKTCA